MDRLLSEQEIELVHKQITNQEFVLYKTDKMIAKAQLAKTDKWWVEKLFAKCPHSSDFKIAAECMICLRSFTGKIELK